MMRSSVIRWLLLAAACVLFSTVAFAQVTTATLQGVVQDPSGSRLPGAVVSVSHDDTAAVRTLTTNQLGEFTMTALPRGAYTVTVELQGFKTHTSKGLDLPAGQTVRQTFDLELGSIGESVIVQGETPLVETSTSHQMETIESVKLSELPLARRNITGLLRLAPGADTTGDTRGVRLNGVGRHGTGISVDGTDANSNPEGRGLSQYQGTNYIDVMSIEAVQEVQLVKGIMPAEYGGVVGGQVNVISRSGTNVFHGSVVENYQGQGLNARDLFLPSRTADGQEIPKPRVVFNQFGASLGGPVLRNRAFFFGTYEGYRESAFQRVQGTVPTQALRDQLLAALPFPETKMALDTVPLPTEPRNQDVGLFVGARNRERKENHVVAKTEMVMGGGAHLTLTYTRMRPFALDPRINIDGIGDRTWTSAQDRVAVNYVMTRGTTVYESRFGYNRNDMARLDQYFEIRDPRQPETNLWGRRLGQINIRGLFSTPGSEVWDMDGTAYNVDQKVSRTFGRHQVKIGARWLVQTGMRSNPENPVFVFQNKADALANIPSEVRPTFGAPPHKSRMDEIGGFAQDDWRVSNRFVLNLGVRYDYYTPVRVDPTSDAPATIVNFGRAADLRRLDFGPQRPADQPYKPDGWVNLAPRAGFAWTLNNDGSSVVRGGFGVFYSPHMPGMVRQGTADPLVPFRVSWGTAAAADRGLKWPLYNDDMRVIVEREAAASGQPFFFSIIDENLQNPYTLHTMLNVQQGLGRRLMTEIGYVRVDGRKLPLQRLFTLAIDRQTGRFVNPALGAPGGYYVDNSQTSEYNALQLSVRRRLASDFSFDVHYTLGKGVSTQGGDIGAYYQADFENYTQDFWNPDADRGPNVSDARHRLTADVVYIVPWFKGGRGLLAHAVGGWEVAAIFTARSGERLLITQPSAIPNSRPDFVGGNPVFEDWRATRLYLNRDSFALVPLIDASRVTERPGTVTTDQVRGPGTWVVDMTFAKNIAVTKGIAVQVRADLFNALNHPNYGNPTTTISDAFFGQIRGLATPPRVIQLGARVKF